jgi:hypothetical protein
MKTTAQRLSEVYCVPQNAKECKALNVSNGEIGMKICKSLVSDGKAIFQGNLGRTEIPVQHFIDLIEDRIVAWRLVEDGFKKQDYGYIFYLKDIEILLDKHFEVYLQDNNDCEMYFDGCKTYTDLLTLIRLL